MYTFYTSTSYTFKLQNAHVTIECLSSGKKISVAYAIKMMRLSNIQTKGRRAAVGNKIISIFSCCMRTENPKSVLLDSTEISTRIFTLDVVRLRKPDKKDGATSFGFQQIYLPRIISVITKLHWTKWIKALKM